MSDEVIPIVETPNQEKRYRASNVWINAAYITEPVTVDLIGRGPTVVTDGVLIATNRPGVYDHLSVGDFEKADWVELDVQYDLPVIEPNEGEDD